MLKLKTQIIGMRPGKAAAILIFFVGLLTILPSCKDTTVTHDEGMAEICRSLVDEKKWATAISICGDVDTDEGRHLTAQSYLGRGGITLFNLTRDMADPANDPSTLLFDYAPVTTSDTNDYKAALDIMMASTMKTKTQTMYLETLLVSSMLVFKELKTLLDLNLTNDTITTCADPSGDIMGCNSFAPDLSGLPGNISYPGLGTAFYDALCEDSSSNTLTAYDDINTITFNPVTINSCTIQTNSVLYYNKLANQFYTGIGINGLSVFDFYNNMDSGNNFTINGPPNFSLCNDIPVGGVPIPDASPDLKLNDCEVLGYLLNTGL